MIIFARLDQRIVWSQLSRCTMGEEDQRDVLRRDFHLRDAAVRPRLALSVPCLTRPDLREISQPVPVNEVD